jgi:hypothetical protein
VPHAIDGIPTDVVDAGSFYSAYQTMIEPGISIGHYKITAGTLGCFIVDTATSESFILSNNHVLANCNDCEIGDAIQYPGPIDCVGSGDIIAQLHWYKELLFRGQSGNGGGNCPIVNGVSSVLNVILKLINSKYRYSVRTTPGNYNLVDMALGKVVDEDVDVTYAMPLETGSALMKGISPQMLGMEVQKKGRTTGYTKGVITDVAWIGMVNYGTDIGWFKNQFVVAPVSTYTKFSAGGDSGSVVTRVENSETDLHAVGLLFAGSDKETICNPMGYVMDEVYKLIPSDRVQFYMEG